MLAPKAQSPDAFGFQQIVYEKTGYQATVTFNRPHVYNCVNFQMLRELTQAFEDASWDDQIAVVILTGAGDKAFCTGADMREQQQFVRRPRDYWKWMGAFLDAHERLRNIGKPTIARLNGIVVGGGNEFNMSCDLAVMVEDAYIRQVGNAHGSVAAAGATQFLPLIVGDRRAREILWLNEEINARKALEWGLVNQVVPRSELNAAVRIMAEKLYNKLAECMRYTKQQTNFWRDLSWHLTVGHARDWLSVHNMSPESHEGVQAFREKRLPHYSMLRQRIAAGGGDYPHGPYTRNCPKCKASDLPEEFEFCGRCGTGLM